MAILHQISNCCIRKFFPVNIIFQCVTFYNCPTTISNSIPCPYNTISNTTLYLLHNYSCDNSIQPGDSIEFNAIAFDHFNNK